MAKVNVFAFTPVPGKTTTVSNATSATAQVLLPKDCSEVRLTNTSTTATAYVRITSYLDSTPPADAAANAPTTTDDYPILPSSQVTIGVGEGYKFIRTIASAADGSIKITPGMGR